MSKTKPPYTIDEDEKERARLASQWLEAGLTPTPYKALPIKWAEKGLRAEIRLQRKDEYRIHINTHVGDVLSVYNRMRTDDHFIAWLRTQMKDDRHVKLDNGETCSMPPSHPNIEYFIETLPDGMKLGMELMKSRDDGLIYPPVAIRYWIDIASRHDDERAISSSGSSWHCMAMCNSRNEAGIITSALLRYEPEPPHHYEVWSLFPFGNALGPHILDHEPGLSDCLHGKLGRSTDITEEDVREFAMAFTLDYYQIHPRNRQFVEVLSCDHHNGHHANWATRVRFSAKGDQVTLLIHPTHQGLEVFATRYEEGEG